ncbi:MAG: isopenicillin N synthase family oxygenase [Cyanobacteria bacterium REEB459]|nr:isopenicillin N synthase family oxygenase [Cyanobacteria bacterium REEB459]
MPQPTIPVINYGDLVSTDPDTRHRGIAAMGLALEQIGFFILDQSPVAPEVLGRAYQMAMDFFTLPAAIKLGYQQAGQGGFSAFGSEQAKGSSRPDLKEFWHVNPASLSQAEALWPGEVPNFQPVMTRLYNQLYSCAMTLLEACALYLGQTDQWLVAMARGGNTLLRLAHYPPLGVNPPPEGLRAAPHEDINLITLLCSATAPGLEILSQEGTWLPIQANPNQVVVDTGDMLQNLTNGLLKSTTHRVINPLQSTQRRLSMPFFVHPRAEIDLSPRPEFIARTGGILRFPQITAGQYLQQRLTEIRVKPQN